MLNESEIYLLIIYNMHKNINFYLYIKKQGY